MKAFLLRNQFLALGLAVLLGSFSSGLRAETVAATVETNNGFQPGLVRIHVGDTVEWKNTSQMIHTVTFDPAQARVASHVVLPEGVVPFGSNELNPGDTFRHTFTVPGTYQYICIPHERFGMIGQIIVE